MSAHDRQVGGDHYQKEIQPWDIIDAYDLDYYEGNALKYLLRDKGDRTEDLQKAIHYLEKELEEEGKNQWTLSQGAINGCPADDRKVDLKFNDGSIHYGASAYGIKWEAVDQWRLST